jgi:hypothetical protein
VSEEIVGLILDGRLSHKWRLTSERDYMSVLLDLDTLRQSDRTWTKLETQKAPPA